MHFIPQWIYLCHEWNTIQYFVIKLTVHNHKEISQSKNILENNFDLVFSSSSKSNGPNKICPTEKQSLWEKFIAPFCIYCPTVSVSPTKNIFIKILRDRKFTWLFHACRDSNSLSKKKKNRSRLKHFNFSS